MAASGSHTHTHTHTHTHFFPENFEYSQATHLHPMLVFSKAGLRTVRVVVVVLVVVGEQFVRSFSLSLYISALKIHFEF